MYRKKGSFFKLAKRKLFLSSELTANEIGEGQLVSTPMYADLVTEDGERVRVQINMITNTCNSTGMFLLVITVHPPSSEFCLSVIILSPRWRGDILF